MQTATSLANQRVFRDRINPLDAYNDTEFITRMRVTRVIFIELYQRLAGSFDKSAMRIYSIPTITQFAVVLQFLATVSFQTVVASTHGISQT